MPKLQSKAHGRFEATHARAKALLDLYDRLLKIRLSKSPYRFKKSELSDLLRSALVLTVAGMDRYFTSRFVEILIPYVKNHSPTDKLIDLLAEAGLDTKQALEMARMDRPYRRIRTLMDAHFEKFSTQKAEVINELFVAYGRKDFLHNAQRRAGRHNLIARLGTITRRRHQIVHEGDLNDHGKLRPIESATTRRQIADIKALVDASETMASGIA